MATNSFFIRTPYYQPFVLDKNKLTRIVGIVLEKLPGTATFITLVMRNSSHLHLKSLEELFAMDNSPSNPIVELRIVFPKKNTTTKLAEIIFRAGTNCRVELVVRGIESRVATQLSAELQEQFERTFVWSWVMRVREYWLPIIGLITLTIFLVAGISLGESRNRINAAFTRQELSEGDRQQLKSRISTAGTLEQKLDVLLEIESKRLEVKQGDNNEQTLLGSLFTRKALLIEVPILVLLAVGVYMILFLYPTGLFIWGDFEEYYQRILDRRRFCSVVVIAGLLINLLSGALWLGLSS